MTLTFSPPQWSVRTEMGGEWDLRQKAIVGTVVRALKTGEEALVLTLVAPVIEGTRGSDKRATDKAAVYGVFPLAESSIASMGD